MRGGDARRCFGVRVDRSRCRVMSTPRRSSLDDDAMCGRRRVARVWSVLCAHRTGGREAHASHVDVRVTFTYCTCITISLH